MNQTPTMSSRGGAGWRWAATLVLLAALLPALWRPAPAAAAPVATTFTNAAPITINDDAPATPYPSAIVASGLCGPVAKVTVTLRGLAHTFPADIGVLLVGPGGQTLILLKEAGDGEAVTGLTLTFDDAAAGVPPEDLPLAGGTFKPSSYDSDNDIVFAPPAPAGPHGTPLPDGTATLASTFNGTAPNGTWQVFVIDAFSGDEGTIANGWELAITPDCRALTVATQGDGAVGRDPAGTGGGPFAYPTGTAVALTPQPGPGQAFLGWVVDGASAGWADPLTVTLGGDRAVQAIFGPAKTFPDVGAGRADYAAITALATRGSILGYQDGSFGPDDEVQRAQMAALIARATPHGPGAPLGGVLAPPACLVAGTWDCEDWGNVFTDRGGLDPNLWRNVGALQHHQVARGYAAADCAARGGAASCFGPTDPVTFAQTISFVTRAMQVKGYWADQPGAPPVAGVPAAHAADAATFAFYTGGIPAPPADWNAPATRGWFARALWAALDRYWGTDGTLPDGRPAGGQVP